MSISAKITMLAATVALTATAVAADARPTRGKIAGQNGSVSAIKGTNGSAVRGRGAVRNADGSVTAGSGGAFKTATGKGYRGSTATVNPDGSANRRSQAGFSGARGSGSTASNVTRNADGSYSGGRTTTATSAVTGNSYNGSTQIDPTTGKPVRSATCTDAGGNAIACPR